MNGNGVSDTFHAHMHFGMKHYLYIARNGQMNETAICENFITQTALCGD